MLISPIYFPALDLEITMSNVAFTVFGKDVYWYGIIIALGFLLAVMYCMKTAPRYGLSEDNIIDMLIFAVPSAIIGARVYYCIFNWELYENNPISVLYIWNGGLAIYGAVIFAVIAVIIFAKVKKLNPGALCDVGGLGLLIGQCIGRWGNFVNREAFGEQTTSLFRMGLMDSNGRWVYYHPAFLYESLWNLAGFIILSNFSKKHRKFDGQLFLMYICWYGLGRGFIEGIRTDSLYFFGTGLRVSQFLGFASCIVCATILFVKLVFKDNDPADMQVWKTAHPQTEVGEPVDLFPNQEEDGPEDNDINIESEIQEQDNNQPDIIEEESHESTAD